MKWYLLGAGNLGTLAAQALQQAGFPVRLAGRGARIHWLSEPHRAPMPVELAGDDGAPIGALILATKGPDTAAALAGIHDRLRPDAVLVRLQNGLDPLHAVADLPGLHRIEAVAFSGAWRDTLDGAPHIHLVARQPTLMGDGRDREPDWFPALQQGWPLLHWKPDIRFHQWRKLAANALINPLTALHDCPNGTLLRQPALEADLAALAQEFDAVAARLFPHWPGNSLALARQVAEDTADNTSSMRADCLAGRVTEIDSITGAVLRQADALGLAVPRHRALWEQVRARHPLPA